MSFEAATASAPIQEIVQISANRRQRESKAAWIDATLTQMGRVNPGLRNGKGPN
jgi:hypothetical protein